MGGSINRTLRPEEEDCYRFSADADKLVTFNVDTPQSQNFDSELELYDRFGDQIGYNDDDPISIDPSLSYTFREAGTYFVIVSGLNESESGDYTLSVYAGELDPALADAEFLPADTRIFGAITAESLVYLEAYDWQGFGNYYTFDGVAGETISIDVYADSLGSQLDPFVVLFNSAGDLLAEDDDGGVDYDSSLTYTLDADGRYYILVASVDDYGTPSDFFYEVLLTR
jgi:hypothetical protein